MATKKMPSTSAAKKTTIIKIAEKVGELAGKIVNKKDHLVGLAGDALASVSGVVTNIVPGKKTTAKATSAHKKVTGSKMPRPAAKKASSSTTSKAPVKTAPAVKKVAAKTAAPKTPAAGKTARPQAAKTAAVEKPAAGKTKAPVARPAVAKKVTKK